MHCNAISIPSFVFHCINIIIYVVCGGVSMALGRFNKRAAFTTFFRNFRLFS